MRLIDADALKSYLYKQPRRYVKSKDGDWQNEGYTCDDVFFAIDKQLTAVLDADPVKHGHWIYDKLYCKWKCSVCGRSPSNNKDGSGNGYVQRCDELWDYCPHCGAKMDEEEKHATD